jgi:hypothetical protein
MFTETSPLEGPVTAVLRVFDVVVGVALERFLKDDRMVDFARDQFQTARVKRIGHNARRWDRLIWETLYWASLVVLVSLALRFAIGSEVHMKHTYVEAKGSVSLFLKDLGFLVLFGVLLVRAALSPKLADFMLWLTTFLVVGMVWSWVEIVTLARSPFGSWWLLINSLQLALTILGWWWVHRKPGHAPYMLAILAVCYAAIFCFDVEQLIETSGPTHAGHCFVYWCGT